MSRMMNGLGIGFALLAMTAAAGCASPTGDAAAEPMQDADLTGAKKVLADKTTSFGGAFAFDYEGEEVKMTFEVSRIDWEAGTAVFDTKIVERGNASVYEDEALRMTIEKGPCDGCHAFYVEQDGQLAVDIRFADSKLSSMTYAGFAAIGPKVATASEAPAASGGGGGNEEEAQTCGSAARPRCFGTLVCDDARTWRCVAR